MENNCKQFFNLSNILKLNDKIVFEKVYRSGIKTHPNDLNYYFHLAIFLKSQFKIKEASEVYLPAIKKFLNKTEPYYQYAGVLISQGKFKYKSI